MAEHSELDHVTGRPTTGHEWDGIKELNTPLPRWWLITFYLTIVWAVGYWIVSGLAAALEPHDRHLELPTRAEVAVELANLEKIRGDKMEDLAPPRWRRSRRIRPCWRWPAPAARRCSATIARHATAAAAAEPRLSQPERRRLAVGRARSTRSCRPSSSAPVPATRSP